MWKRSPRACFLRDQEDGGPAQEAWDSEQLWVEEFSRKFGPQIRTQFFLFGDGWLVCKGASCRWGGRQRWSDRSWDQAMVERACPTSWDLKEKPTGYR